jgi:hypothetical protein
MWHPFSNKNEWKEHLNACKISGNQQKKCLKENCMWRFFQTCNFKWKDRVKRNGIFNIFVAIQAN